MNNNKKVEGTTTTMATIPTEIITEILSRLPVKSLLRFKSVCKSWYSLIKNPNFIKLHLNQSLISSSSHLHLLISQSLYACDFNSHQLSFSKLLHPFEPHQFLRFIGSCNGVICFSDASNTDIFLFNPLTKSCRKLPPIKLSPFIGFGFDPKNGDYKVLSWYKKIKVYSFNNNSWKSVESTSHLDFVPCSFASVLFNDALHYVVCGPDNYLIAKFDLQTESFSLMELPNYYEKAGFPLLPILAELGGCLTVTLNHCYLSNPRFKPDHNDLWVMREYGKKESWFRLIRIIDNDVTSNGTMMKPIVHSKDGKRILLDLQPVVTLDSEMNTSGFGWYDLESKTVERFTPHGLPEGKFETLKFVGSLVSLEDKVH